MRVPTPRWRRSAVVVANGYRFNTSKVARRALADAVRVARREAGLTQAELGERAGVAGTTVSNVESGRSWPKVDTLASIAVALRTSLSDLVGV